MTPTKPGDYMFNPSSLIEIRKKLNLSQIEMAKLLGVPTNTLYRWENANTNPDASSLASVFSIAISNGIKPNFFVRRSPVKEKTVGRQNLFVMWDFQNLGVSAKYISQVSTQIKDHLLQKFSSTSHRLFKAFSSLSQSDATDIMNKLGWRVWEDDTDMDDEIIDQCRSDCGAEPNSTILVLITKDGDFTDLIEELKTKGVRIYLMAPNNANEDLINAVGKKRWIALDSSYLSIQDIRKQNVASPQYMPVHSSYYDEDDD